MSNKDKEVITDPLEAIHEIQQVCYSLNRYIDAMYVLGINSAEHLEELSNKIYDLAQISAKGIMKETHERFKDSQQASANILNTVLAMSELNNSEEE